MAKKEKKKPVKSKRNLQKERQDKRCIEACLLIEEGRSVRKAMKAKKLSSDRFYQWVDESDENQKHFARACEDRHDLIFEECLEIADDDGDDEKAYVGINHIQRDKLKIQTRLDMLKRMNPKKYGEKVEVNGTQDVTISFK